MISRQAVKAAFVEMEKKAEENLVAIQLAKVLRIHVSVMHTWTFFFRQMKNVNLEQWGIYARFQSILEKHFGQLN